MARHEPEESNKTLWKNSPNSVCSPISSESYFFTNNISEMAGEYESKVDSIFTGAFTSTIYARPSSYCSNTSTRNSGNRDNCLLDIDRVTIELKKRNLKLNTYCRKLQQKLSSAAPKINRAAASIRVGSSWAINANTRSALSSAFQELMVKLSGKLHFLIVSFSCELCPDVIVSYLKEVAPDVPYIGGTIARGSFGKVWNIFVIF